MGVLGFAVLFGWVALAIGAYRSGVLGLVRSMALGSMALLLRGRLRLPESKGELPGAEAMWKIS